MVSHNWNIASLDLNLGYASYVYIAWLRPSPSNLRWLVVCEHAAEEVFMIYFDITFLCVSCPGDISMDVARLHLSVLARLVGDGLLPLHRSITWRIPAKINDSA